MATRVVVMTYSGYMVVVCSDPDKQYLVREQEHIGKFVEGKFELVERRKDDPPAKPPSEEELKAIYSILVVAEAALNTSKNIG
jgi:hypothetical protein